MLRKPSGRQEVVQLTRMMDDMLLKAGVDEPTEELTEISQVRRQPDGFQFETQITRLLADSLLFPSQARLAVFAGGERPDDSFVLVGSIEGFFLSFCLLLSCHAGR